MASLQPCGMAAASEPVASLARRMVESTSKGTYIPAILMLADGHLFKGRAVGALGTAVGEVCFNTALEGYFEVLTDPSYAGQIVTMTYPQIGNYGLASADAQGPASRNADTAQPALKGMVVRDLCTMPSNWRSAEDLSSYLKRNGVIAIEGIDTRSLVRILRDGGAQKGIITTEVFDVAELQARLECSPDLVGSNLVATVSCEETYTYGPENLPDDHDFARTTRKDAPTYRVVAYDCGIKRGILEGLARVGCSVEVVAWDTPASEVLARHPDGVFLSNGPGDPDAVGETYHAARELLGKVPLFGICLGHQMISLAAGAHMVKLPFGHHGGNHPVMNLLTRRVEITAQNHGFNLDFSSLGPLVPGLSGGIDRHPSADLRWWVERGVAPVVENQRYGKIRLTHVNLNDGTAEGMQFIDIPAFSVQYHPEAAPGPTDAGYLFQAFARLMDGHADYLDIDIASSRLADWNCRTIPVEA